MQGQHIYRAIRGIVHFGEQFMGIRSIASVHREATGMVVKSAMANATPDERLCDTPMLDSMMHFAGLLINYFTHPSDEDLLVCSQIERFEIGGGFNPEAGKWMIYANLTEDSDKETLCDVYVLEAESKKLVIAMLGFNFFKTTHTSLARMSKDVNVPLGDASSSVGKESKASFHPVPVASKREESLTKKPKAPPKKSSSVRADLIELLSKVTDIPVEDLTDEATLEDIGIDSLMVTEVLNEYQKAFGVNIDMTTFLFFETVRAVTTHLDEKLGNSQDADMGAEAQTCGPAAASTAAPTTQERPKISPSRPSIPAAHQAFEEI